jgi:YrbI family 3-deoxy-D-manno-octulosonate 8-phosphate phosphatase
MLPTLTERCSKITLLLSDVDGVLTDGGLIFDSQGGESKTFHIHDGMGIRLWREVGNHFGIITHRKSTIVERRAVELRADFLRQGAEDKLTAVDEIADEIGITRDNICYVGDDLLDVRTICSVGLGVAVADAAQEVRAAAAYVTSVRGGRGAVREVVELILRNTDRWEGAVQSYMGAAK